jgi:hypothetical protein
MEWPGLFCLSCIILDAVVKDVIGDGYVLETEGKVLLILLFISNISINY